MNWADWLGLTLLCLAGAASPGPSLLLVIRHALRGARAGMQCALAHAAGVGVYAVLAVTGLALLFQRLPLARDGIQCLGALWLLHLASRLWSARAWRASDAAVGKAWRDGFLMALLNPKVALFFVVVFAPFLPAGVSPGHQAGMAMLAAVVDAGWYAAIVALLSVSRVDVWLQQHAILLDRCSSGVFTAAALLLFYEVLSRWLHNAF